MVSGRTFWLVPVLLVASTTVLAKDEKDLKKIVFIAGTKSHGPGHHEYEKGLRLLKQCIDKSPNLNGFKTEVHTDGWPKDASTLNDADTIVLFSDGSDRDEKRHPILKGDRLKILSKQMKRGCGLVAIHYTVFVPNKRGGEQFLEWLGGYFDYQSGKGPRGWYSKIKTATTTAKPGTPGHPVCEGLKPFKLREEYYYNIRFAAGERRVHPILVTPIPGEAKEQTVAWCIERKDGGRGFGFTGGHFHDNWQVDGFRRMVLNAIVWTAKGKVPRGGVQSSIKTSKTNEAKPVRALIVTGAQHPAHTWEETTTSLEKALDGRKSRFRIRVTKDPEFLAKAELHDFDVVVMNYCNWKKPGLSEAAKKNFVQFLKNGGGLSIIHFANGAFHFSLPEAKESDWPEWRTKICRRVWDHTRGKSGHDRYDRFRVEIINLKHPITRGMASFETTDELYFRQQGTEPIEVLATARSKITGKPEPMAFVYQYGKGRVFQTVLGHDVPALRTDGTAALIRRGTLWASGRALPPYVPLAAIAETWTQGKFGKALNGNAGGVFVPGSEDFRKPPITVECWTKLSNKRDFNILVANELKSSATHWELYTYARSGKLSAYLPGMEPSEIVSSKNICDDKWHHVAMTYEADRIRLYLDGKLVKDQKIKPKGQKGSPRYLAIGQLVERTIRCDGLIDDVRISHGVKTIQSVPKGPLKREKDTIALWSFDEASPSFIDPAWTPRVDVNALYPWMKETDKDWVDERFQQMDTGPMLGASFAIPGKPRVNHGLSIVLGDKGEAAVLYDKNLVRLAAAWTGDYLKHSSRRFGLLNTPEIAGNLQFATDAEPGWRKPSGVSGDPVSRNEPLPGGWAGYKGAQLYGKRTVVEWEVGSREVREMPWVETKGDVTVFTRTFEVAPGSRTLHLNLGQSSGTTIKKIEGATLIEAEKGRNARVVAIQGNGRIEQKEGKLSLVVAESKEVTGLTLLHWSGKKKQLARVEALIRNVPKMAGLPGREKGVAGRYRKPLVTKGKVASSRHGPFVVDTLTIPYTNPHKALFFASGLDFLKNGDIAVCTAHGDVWLVSGADDKLEKLSWKRFATGLYQPLGLKVVEEQIYVLERGQLTRLHDFNKDGEADRYECVNNDWIVLGEEHGYTTCLERDSKGWFYFFKTGSHGARTGGSLLRVSPDGRKMEIFCTGFRHPNGLGMGPGDMITGAGQEGNWVPKTRLDTYQKGGFYGDMRAHHRPVPPLTYDKPICWLPREVDGSGGGQVWIPKGHWGPLGGQLLHMSYGHCKLMTVLFEKVEGQIQGGAVRLPMKFLAGICRGRFREKDRSLYVCGLDGWQTAAVEDGCLQRVRYVGEDPGIPIAVHANKNGIRIRFSKPLDRGSCGDVNRYFLEQCNYRWSAEYGSKDWSVIHPDQEGRDQVQVKSAKVLSDGRTVFLEIPDLVPVMQIKIRYSLKAKDGKAIEGDYHGSIHKPGKKWSLP